MEMSHSLILNEEALAKIPEAKKSLFVYEWLQFLENVLIAAQKVNNSIFFNLILIYLFLCRVSRMT